MNKAKSVQKVQVYFYKAFPQTPTFKELQSEIATLSHYTIIFSSSVDF